MFINVNKLIFYIKIIGGNIDKTYQHFKMHPINPNKVMKLTE